MKKNIPLIVIALATLGGLAAYFLWRPAPPEPAPISVQTTPSKPLMRQVIEVPPASPPLPALGESDNFMLDALGGLVGNPSLMKLFRTEKIIRNIVVTVDNLPRDRVPINAMPIKPVPGLFLAAGTENAPIIGPQNAARYAPYMKIAEAMEAKKLVELYIRLYPLFQQAYEDLGYPKQYFNDRLLVVIDDLLAAPDINEPVKLVRPNVLYLFADPDLEERSIGQRALMRIGNKNGATIKARLREIKQELTLHMRETKMPN
ncbi:MAG: DUF3014 domain-containing protein [Nitrosomonadales bacterium]|nr:DUF3014 domain-containing protein [Nitrosomonadales bacterium]